MSVGRVGSFALGRSLGRGTYGEVWEGKHVRAEVGVAIKFLPWQGAADPGLRRALQREARLLATLDHPHVVRLLDHGAVSERESRSTSGRWPGGTPYLVLEYVGGGTCSEVRGQLPWPTLRDLLFRVLDGLAHAHARDVIHLDLKPANILLGGRLIGSEVLDGQREAASVVAGLRLADFGIAGVFGKRARRRSSVGTPAYMAPEQLRQAWRDFGSWTDLYALGCTAWSLVTGRSPFHGLRGRDLALAQAYREPPPLVPRMAVPDGLEDWLRALLAKDPAERPARCAEAAQGLSALGEASPSPELPVRTRTSDLNLPLSEQPTALFSELGDDIVGLTPAPSPAATLASENLGSIHTWRRAEPTPTPLTLADAGLGLLGLRVPRLVGQEPLRDALWKALLRVRDTGASQAVVLRGPGGRGVSRLAGWLGQRSHELGIGEPVLVRHAPDDPDAVLTALRDWVRGWDLDRDALALRTARLLRRWGADPTWLAGMAAGLLVQRDPVPWTAATDGVLVRLLVAAGTRRTVVLILDDAQWGPAGLRLARALLAEPSARVLVVVTLQDDADAHTQATEMLAGLTAVGRCETHAVPPLPDRDARRLLEDTLMLEPLLAARVVALAGGNPRLALQVVGEWAQRGQLLRTAEGFVLEDPDGTGVPGDLAEVLLARLARIEGGDPVPLELAAALGTRFEHRDWEALCGPVEPLANRTAEAGLLLPTRQGWRFQSGAVREVLAERARTAGRQAGHHTRCVALLAGQPMPPARLGLHLLESGDAEAAFERLYEGAQQARAQGLGQQALQLADLSARALGVMAPAPSDERLGQQLLLECALLRDLGDEETLELRSSRLLAMAQQHGWATLRGEALRARALALRDRRDPHCEAVFQQALACFVDLDDPWRACRVQTDLANLFSMIGLPDQAETHATLAVRGARSLSDQEGLAMGLLARSLARERQGRLEPALADARAGLAVTVTEGVPLWIVNGRRRFAQVLALSGQIDAARQELEQLVHVLRQQLSLSALGTTLNNLGDLERQGGDPARAEACYREVVALGRLVGHARHFARLNLALLWLQDGRPSEVMALVAPVQDHAAEIGHGLLEACAGALLCWAAASLGDGPALGVALDRTEALVARLGLPDPDLALSLAQAGAQALVTLDRPTAARALRLAADIHRRRGDPDAAQACLAQTQAAPG